ncbi:nibrin-like isoform X2 [Mya arenaria]|uniref:nibrin-like isoform X2 n=1 Tax=Mya arenaria TaxID=6604 RepID=UPI0022E8B289|nr:nibrin-like isoform X2 [Mya arenaria]
MWYIISSSNPDQKIVILCEKTYVVGRRDCDVLVVGDATVSRKHAEISMTHSEGNLGDVKRLPMLRLKDVSKFGSYVNGKKIDGEHLLSDGDRLYFGSPKSAFMAVFEPLALTTSCLDVSAKKSVRQQLITLGGHMTSEWQRGCSLLVMSKISVTIKAICALVSQCPIVTPDYLAAMVTHLQGTTEKPDPFNFTPNLAETQLDPSEVSFKSDIRRKTLFQGKTFVFLSAKQFKKMSFAIELAGGVPVLMEEGGEKSVLLANQTIVMSCQEGGLSHKARAWVTRVQQMLDRQGKHMVQDAEIGYAVLYCSTEKHCNPDFATDDLSKLPSQTLSQMEPFVSNTELDRTTRMSQLRRQGVDSQAKVDETRLSVQTQSQTTQRKSPKVVELQKKVSPQPEKDRNSKQEKMTSNQSNTPNRKRGRATELEEEDPGSLSKRMKAEPVTPGKLAQQFASTSKSSTPHEDSSHAPKSSTDSKKSRRLQKLDEWDEDDEFDFSSVDIITTPTSGSGKVIKQAPSPQRASSPNRSRSRSPHHQTKGNKNKRQKETETVNETTAHKTIANRNVRSRSKSPAPSPKSPSKSSRSKASGQTSGQAGIIEVKTEVLSPEPRAGQVIYDRTRTKQERVMEDDDDTGDTKQGVLQPGVPSGFLTTTKPIQGQVERHRDYEEDTELPSGVVQVEMVSLVARRPRPPEQGAGDCPEGFTRWRGKVVRNYKKFRKNSNAGCEALPRIIGGSDLEVHVAQRSKELDDWFRDTMQAESQQSKDDEKAEQMFNFDRGASSGKRRGR